MEEKDLLQNSCGGFPYLQIRDAAFSLDADCKSASNRSSLFLSADCKSAGTPNGLAYLPNA